MASLTGQPLVCSTKARVPGPGQHREVRRARWQRSSAGPAQQPAPDGSPQWRAGGRCVKAGTGRLPGRCRGDPERPQSWFPPPGHRPSTALPSPDKLWAGRATPPAPCHDTGRGGVGGSSQSPCLLGPPGRGRRHGEGVTQRTVALGEAGSSGEPAETSLRTTLSAPRPLPGGASCAQGPAPLPRAARTTGETRSMQ